jgi:hypothetical protein
MSFATVEETTRGLLMTAQTSDDTETRPQIEAMIRFGLATLGEQNAHHEFEALCREFALQAFTTKIIPATGPVSAGGDQGIDFDTYEGLPRRLGPLAIFYGIRDDQYQVFACTLEKQAPAKVKSDLKTISELPTNPKQVIYFSSQPVTIATRNSLKKHALERYGISLTILDGPGLATQLSLLEHRWIAEHYLDLPAFPEEASPSSQGCAPDRYEAVKNRYRSEDVPLTAGNFYELRDQLREARYHADAAGDVRFWISRMSRYFDFESPDVAHQAQYEVIAATLRGLGHLQGEEHLVRRYYSIPPLPTIRDYEDASNLLWYLFGAIARHLISISNAELESWACLVEEGLRSRLAASPTGLEKCELKVDLAKVVLLREMASDSHEVVVALLREVVEDSRSNPAYPILRLSRYVKELVPIIVTSPGYEGLRAALDKRVAEVSGAATAAEMARDRGKALEDAGKPVHGLMEYGAARVGWSGGDTIRGSLLCYVPMADILERLGLRLAAKLTFLTGSERAARYGHYDLAAAGAFGAGDCDYALGAWRSAAALLVRAIVIQGDHVPDPWDFERHDYLQHVMFEWSIIRAAAESKPVPALAAALQRADEHDIFRSLVGDELADKVQRDYTWDHIRTQAIADGIGEPFSDLPGQARSIDWNAAGVSWRVSFVAGDLPAERTASILQLVCASLCLEPDLGLSGRSVSVWINMKPTIWTPGLVVAIGATSEPSPRDEVAQSINAIGALLEALEIEPERVARVIDRTISHLINPYLGFGDLQPPYLDKGPSE